MTTTESRRNNCEHLLKRNHLFFHNRSWLTLRVLVILLFLSCFDFCNFFAHIQCIEMVILKLFFLLCFVISPYMTSPSHLAHYVFRWPPLHGRIYNRQLSPAIPYFQVFSREWPTYDVRVPGAIGRRFMDSNGG